MKVDPKQILTQYEPVIRSAMEQSFQNWQNYHMGRITELESILNSFKILLVHTDEWAKKPDSFWAELEIELSKIRLWTESLVYVSQDDLNNKIANPLNSEFDKLTSEYPNELRVIIGDTYWLTEKTDPLSRRIRKKYQPIKNKSHEQLHKFINKYRHFKDKPPIKTKAPERVIELHSLLVFYIRIPLVRFLIDEWQRYLQAITGQIFVLHMNIREFTSKSLILEELPKILDPARKNEIFKNLFELAEILKNIDETIQALNKYDHQFLDRFEKRWTEISENFLKVWEWAGTFQLKNKNYTGEQLDQLEYAIDSRFKKITTAWEEHFLALQGEWQKDTEIALLRYKTTKNLYQTSKRLHDGIQQDTEKSLSRVKTLLSETSEKIIQAKDDDSLSTLISRNRKSILSALQELLETIHGVNILRLLEDFISDLWADVENLNSEHRVFVRQDTEKRPPRPVTEMIPLKELVKREIFIPAKEKFTPFADDIETKVENILRVISEIDQMIEFNTDSTLKLISHSKDLPVLERAKSEISEGLDRSARRISDLRLNIARIPEESNAQLLEFSLSFEKNLGKFLEGEKLFKFKKQLKRKRFRKQVAKSIKRFIKATSLLFPYLYNSSKNSIIKIWSKYFSLAPFKPFSQEIQLDRVNKYLKETEYRITQLPYIYQKLFHFQPLYDQRFFSNREKEISDLKDEFQLWKEGSGSAASIIGERGSGITSFLNYAYNNIFDESFVTHLIIDQPVTDHMNIRRLIADTFNVEKYENWEDLEQEILAQNTIQICIFENIQYLFLKTISGFNGLEKFLQLLSHTKHHVFWITSCTLYSWHFLEKAIGIRSYFQRFISLEEMSAAELKAVILKRHRASGYHLEFEPNHTLRKTKRIKAKNEKPADPSVERDYFDKLYAYAGGNISTALLIWLRSIKEFSKERMVLSSDFEIEFSFLEEMPEENLITLTTILHHESISPDQYALVFRQNHDKSRVQLETLQREGLLMKNGNGYQIHPFIYRPLVQVLKKKKIMI